MFLLFVTLASPFSLSNGFSSLFRGVANVKCSLLCQSLFIMAGGSPHPQSCLPIYRKGHFLLASCFASLPAMASSLCQALVHAPAGGCLLLSSASVIGCVSCCSSSLLPLAVSHSVQEAGAISHGLGSSCNTYFDWKVHHRGAGRSGV